MAIRKINSRSIEDGAVASAEFSGAVPSLSSSGNLTFNTTSQRINGEFSNATINSRTIFNTTTTNGTTGIYAIPNGAATAASWQATNNSDATNASKVLIATNGTTDVQLVSGRNGTGTYLPLSFYTNGSEQMRLTTGGAVGISTVPQTWYASEKPLQLGNGASITGRTNSYSEMNLYGNSYTNASGATTYIGSDYAEYYTMSAGAHIWYNAPSGTAGNPITFTERLRIGATGQGTVTKTMTADGIGYQVKSSYTANPSIIELGQSSSDGYIKVLDASGNATRITGYSAGQSYFNCSVGFGGTTTTATYPISVSQGVSVASGGNARIKIGTHIIKGAANDDLYIYGYNGETTGGLLYVGAYYTFSARSIKSNITPLQNSLDKICQLNGYSYTITETERNDIGLIADEVEPVFPDLVSHDIDTGEANSVDYQSLVAVLIEAVKELKVENDALKARLDAAGL